MGFHDNREFGVGYRGIRPVHGVGEAELPILHDPDAASLDLLQGVQTEWGEVGVTRDRQCVLSVWKRWLKH